MEIPLFEDDKPLAIERCVLYPYPDLKRIWTRLWLTAVQEEDHPNLEVAIYNPDGVENTSVFPNPYGDGLASERIMNGILEKAFTEFVFYPDVKRAA